MHNRAIPTSMWEETLKTWKTLKCAWTAGIFSHRWRSEALYHNTRLLNWFVLNFCRTLQIIIHLETMNNFHWWMAKSNQQNQLLGWFYLWIIIFLITASNRNLAYLLMELLMSKSKFRSIVHMRFHENLFTISHSLCWLETAAGREFMFKEWYKSKAIEGCPLTDYSDMFPSLCICIFVILFPYLTKWVIVTDISSLVCNFHP